MSNSTIDQAIKSKLVSENVLVCVSELIEELLQKEEYQEELYIVAIQDDYLSPASYYIEMDMTTRECYDYIVNELLIDAHGPSKTQLLKEITESSDALQDFTDYFGIDPEQNEALEFWIVSDYFFRKLQERGEMVTEFKGLLIWGRTTSGQSISIDGVIDDIAKDMSILEGQENHKYWLIDNK